MTRLLSLSALVLLLVAPLAAQPMATDALPFDPAVRVGTLDNGLKYYVRANTEPEGRAELRLAVNAGSILEDEDQQGLAHFLEHMAFNGTERFAEPELVRYLESVGTRFGPDLNAYTSFDETVYILQVPTDSADVFTTGLDVLREWAGRIVLADSAVDRERGVVLEEWRIGRGAQQRIQRQQFPVIYAGSQYAERLPIGQAEVIETAPTSALQRFYDDWYRPDLMAVIVVGDVDVDATEAMIRARFSDMTNPASPRDRTLFQVPLHDETRYTIATDPEAPQTLVQITYKLPADHTRTVGDLREDLVEAMFFSAMRARLDEIRQQPGAPFAIAFAGSGSGIRTLDGASLVALAGDGQITDAIGALATEAERARRYGITAGEFDRTKADVLRGFESAVAEQDNQPSRNLAGAYIQSFLQDEPVMSPADRFALAQRLIPTITLDEVNAIAEELVAEENRTVVVTAPERDGLDGPHRGRPARHAGGRRQRRDHGVRGRHRRRTPRGDHAHGRPDRGRGHGRGLGHDDLDAVQRRDRRPEADDVQGRRGLALGHVAGRHLAALRRPGGRRRRRGRLRRRRRRRGVRPGRAGQEAVRPDRPGPAVDRRRQRGVLGPSGTGRPGDAVPTRLPLHDRAPQGPERVRVVAGADAGVPVQPGHDPARGLPGHPEPDAQQLPPPLARACASSSMDSTAPTSTRRSSSTKTASRTSRTSRSCSSAPSSPTPSGPTSRPTSPACPAEAATRKRARS